MRRALVVALGIGLLAATPPTSSAAPGQRTVLDLRVGPSIRGRVSVSARVSGHSLIVSFRAATLELPKHRGPLHLEYGAASLCGGRIGNVSESRLVKIRPVTRSRRVTGSAPAVDLTVPIGGCKRTAPLGAFVRVAIEQSGQHLPLAAVTGSIPTLVR